MRKVLEVLTGMFLWHLSHSTKENPLSIVEPLQMGHILLSFPTWLLVALVAFWTNHVLFTWSGAVSGRGVPVSEHGKTPRRPDLVLASSLGSCQCHL